MRRFAIAALTILAFAGATILYMGWLGTAGIAHRDFDIGGFLISAAIGVWLLLRSKSVEKPE